VTGLPQRNSSQPWSTRATAFALARQDDRWLMLRHRRLDVVRWELPGGHVEAGETLEHTARRETLEETGVDVEIGQLLATCVHEWAERRQRRLIAFFAASARDLHLLPGPQESEPEVLGAHWRNPSSSSARTSLPSSIPLSTQETRWAAARHCTTEQNTRGDQTDSSVPSFSPTFAPHPVAG